MRPRPLLFLLCAALLPGPAAQAEDYPSEKGRLQVQTVVAGLEHP